MTVVNTNISALIANNAISQNDRAMSSSMEKLATGSRITSAKDDAAGLAMSSRMSTQALGLNTAVRNVDDAISLLQMEQLKRYRTYSDVCMNWLFRRCLKRIRIQTGQH